MKTIEPSGFEQLALWITALAPLFLLGGMLGAYIEFKTPGFGLPGILSICCFAIFFTGHYIAGLAGWEVGVLFVIGLMLVLGELLLHPGTVVPGVAGALLMVGALIWAMVDRYPGEPFLPTSAMLVRPMVNLGIAFVLAIIAGGALAKYLPRPASTIASCWRAPCTAALRWLDWSMPARSNSARAALRKACCGQPEKPNSAATP